MTSRTVLRAIPPCHMARVWVFELNSILKLTKELNGFPCSGLSIGRDSRKGILTSRMFGKPLFDLPNIQEAIATFASRAAEKLRALSSPLKGLTGST